MIRLTELTPQGVADEVAGWVQEHVTAFGCVGAPANLPAFSECVFELARYAIEGLCAADAMTCVDTVARLLYTAPHPDVYAAYGWARRDADPERAIDCVIRASLARLRLADGKRVPLGWLGPLVGLPVATLRSYGSRGDFSTVRDGELTAGEATRWLQARGVAGFGSGTKDWLPR